MKITFENPHYDINTDDVHVVIEVEEETEFEVRRYKTNRPIASTSALWAELSALIEAFRKRPENKSTATIVDRNIPESP